MDQFTQPPEDEVEIPPLARARPLTQWCLLLLLSAVLLFFLQLANVPAALLIGSMLAGIISGINGSTIRVPKPAFGLAQGVIGCLIASSVSSDILSLLYMHWLPILGAVLATLAASGFLGWLISRLNILPGTTALWGSTPGAAVAMILMARAFGADQQLVAVMQYLRVLVISLSVSVVASLWVDTTQIASPDVTWFSTPGPGLFVMLAVAIIGSGIGVTLRLPSPFFLGAMILGIALRLGMGLEFELPPWLLALTYMLIGWQIGLDFTRKVFQHALRVLPQILGSIAVLIIFCAALGWLMSYTLGIDPMTAYLATSPGAMETIAIIAAATDNVDLAFVMALQTTRFLIVLLIGPPLMRLFARKLVQ